MGMYFPCACVRLDQEINIKEKKLQLKMYIG